MIEQTRFGTRRTIRGEFDAVVDSTRRALVDQTFRIVSETGFDEDSRRCTVIAAWNSLASAAVRREPEVGAVLPCSVVVYEEGAGVCVVSTVDPCNALEVLGSDTLVEQAVLDSREKLQRAIESV